MLSSELTIDARARSMRRDGVSRVGISSALGITKGQALEFTKGVKAHKKNSRYREPISREYPTYSTSARPGSAEKIDILRCRLADGFSLWHKDDAALTLEKPKPYVDTQADPTDAEFDESALDSWLAKVSQHPRSSFESKGS